MDKFPEAFQRFEQNVNTDEIRSFNELRMVFGHWAGSKWKETPRQIQALKIEAARLRIGRMPMKPRYVKPRVYRRKFGRGREGTTIPPLQPMKVKQESINVRGRKQVVFRDVRTGRFMRNPWR